MEVNTYTRVPFEVDAVQVTEENIEEVAKWCMGDIRTTKEPKSKYIKVRVYRPADPNQTKAFIGDWVLYAGTGYKVYRDRAFRLAFELAKSEEAPSDDVDV